MMTLLQMGFVTIVCIALLIQDICYINCKCTLNALYTWRSYRFDNQKCITISKLNIKPEIDFCEY